MARQRVRSAVGARLMCLAEHDQTRVTGDPVEGADLHPWLRNGRFQKDAIGGEPVRGIADIPGGSHASSGRWASGGFT
jgi:hypothetical protein